jgi:hypothetical protein
MLCTVALALHYCTAAKLDETVTFRVLVLSNPLTALI